MLTRAIDLTGQVFGNLTVLHRIPQSFTTKSKSAVWLCSCACGKTSKAPGRRLRNGDVKSCGCLFSRTTIDLTGQVFGRLTVICRTKSRRDISDRSVRWVCQCTCGTVKEVSGRNLRNGGTRSCGCLNIENSTKQGRNTLIDLTGMVFGRLTVLSRASNRGKSVAWNCSCECGSTIEVSGVDLRRGHTRSCGCLLREHMMDLGRSRLKDLTGQVFGRLTVISRIAGKKGDKNAVWFCVCTCGKSTSVTGASLRSGSAKSCGCLHRETSAEAGRASLRDLTGLVFGRLTVIERFGTYQGQAVWLCQCSCGNKTDVRSSSLIRGETTSCGCFAREQTGERSRRQAGPNHPNWQGGITQQNYAIRNSAQNKEWRAAVYARDNYTCQMCGAKSSPGVRVVLNADHIKPFSVIVEEHNIRNLDQAKQCSELWDVSNGRTLCEPCHLKLSTHGRGSWRKRSKEIAP